MKNMTDNFMISFLQRFDEHPFDVKIHGKTHHIGSGNPAFVVDLKEDIEGKELLTSTSLALGEAYMKGLAFLQARNGAKAIVISC